MWVTGRWFDALPREGADSSGGGSKRSAIVLSPAAFNTKVLLALVAPITSRVRGHGFEVPLEGNRVNGVVLCQQVKMIDFIERGLQFAEKASDTVTGDALAKVRAIVSE